MSSEEVSEKKNSEGVGYFESVEKYNLNHSILVSFCERVFLNPSSSNCALCEM